MTPRRDPLVSLAGPARPLTLRESAAVLGGLRFVELASFRRLGRLASGRAGAISPAGAVWAAESSLAHARRAAELEALLPVSSGLPDAEECTRSPGAEVSALVADLEKVGDPSSPEQASPLDALYLALAQAYAFRAAHASPAADRAQRRVLERARQDVEEVTRALADARQAP